MRKCRHCRSELPAKKHSDFYQSAGFCNNDHMAAFGLAKARKAQERKEARQKAEKKKAIREAKQAIKPLSKLKAEAQAVINRYARLRDARKGCVSCDKPSDWHGQWHASHYRPVGRNQQLRYNLFNIHKACSVCNAHLSGNLLPYREELIRRIGRERVEWLETNQDHASYTREYLERLKRVFSKRCRMMEKRIEGEA